MRVIKRDIVGIFIFSKDNFLLLGKSRKGGVYKDQWIVPGGGIEPGETKLQAAKREAMEEVGIDISQGRIEEINEPMYGKSEKNLRDTGEHVLVEMTFYDFIIRFDRPSREIVVSCQDDIVEARWFGVADFKNIKMSEPTYEILLKLGYLQD